MVTKMWIITKNTKIKDVAYKISGTAERFQKGQVCKQKI